MFYGLWGINCQESETEKTLLTFKSAYTNLNSGIRYLCLCILTSNFCNIPYIYRQNKITMLRCVQNKNYSDFGVHIMKKSTKALLIVISIILVSVIALLLIVGAIFGDKIKAVNSVEKLSDGLYYMEYEGDYGFDDFLSKGGAKNQSEVASYITFFLSGGFC